MYGPWTLNAPLGKGAYGKVYSATDHQGRLAAIKIISRETTRLTARHEIDNFRKLAKSAGSETDRGRILRLVDVIPPDLDKASPNAPFLDDVALITMPCCHGTFADLVEARKGFKK